LGSVLAQVPVSRLTVNNPSYTITTLIKSTRRNRASQLVTKYNIDEINSLQKVDCDKLTATQR